MIEGVIQRLFQRHAEMILFRAFDHMIILNATHQAVTKLWNKAAASGDSELSKPDMRRLDNNLLDNGRFSCHDWEFPQTEDQIIARDRKPGFRLSIVLTNSADHCKRILGILFDFEDPEYPGVSDTYVIFAETNAW